MRKMYEVGTEVQCKNGRVIKKTENGTWIGRGRYVYMKENHTSLDRDQRVFHIDGDRMNDEPENLIPIRFGGPVYRLAHARVVFRPHKLLKKEKTVAI